MVVEGLARRSGNVVGPFWLALLSSVHLDTDARSLKNRAQCILRFSSGLDFLHPKHTEAVGECDT